MSGVTGPDDALADQLRYYRVRAGEYDRTSFGVRTGERHSVPAIVDRLAPSGAVLELACGTGVWTVELARFAATVTALDAAPEMLDLAARRVRSARVRFRRADIFRWTPTRRYDMVFFAFWLSHVPPQLFARFWELVAAALHPGGRAVFVDELPARAVHETFLSDHLVRRGCADGSVHRVVKVFYPPVRLTRLLGDLGWRATVAPIEHGWFLGQADRPEVPASVANAGIASATGPQLRGCVTRPAGIPARVAPGRSSVE